MEKYVERLHALKGPKPGEGADGMDEEGVHIGADKIILEALDELAPAISAAYRALEDYVGNFWYA